MARFGDAYWPATSSLWVLLVGCQSPPLAEMVAEGRDAGTSAHAGADATGPDPSWSVDLVRDVAYPVDALLVPVDELVPHRDAGFAPLGHDAETTPAVYAVDALPAAIDAAPNSSDAGAAPTPDDGAPDPLADRGMPAPPASPVTVCGLDGVDVPEPPCNGCPAGVEVPLGWVCIPPTEEEEEPQPLGPWLMKSTEVTVDEWTQVIESPYWPGDPDSLPAHAAVPLDAPDLGERPVSRISYFDALVFLNTWSKSEGRRPCYRLYGCRGEPGLPDGPLCGLDCRHIEIVEGCDGYRLPKISLWDRAAGPPPRAAALAEVAWHGDHDLDGPQAVARLHSNRLGLFDMYGNVAEWTHRNAGPCDMQVYSWGCNSPISIYGGCESRAECPLGHICGGDFNSVSAPGPDETVMASCGGNFDGWLAYLLPPSSVAGDYAPGLRPVRPAGRGPHPPSPDEITPSRVGRSGPCLSIGYYSLAEYDDGGRITRSLSYPCTTGRTEFRYTYDDQGRLQRSIHGTDLDGAGTPSGGESWAYEGDRVTAHGVGGDPEARCRDGFSERYEFAADDRIVSMEAGWYADDVACPSREERCTASVEHTYEPQGHVQQTELRGHQSYRECGRHNPMADEWENDIHTVHFEFDATGRLIRELYTFESNGCDRNHGPGDGPAEPPPFISTLVVTHVYNAAGNLAASRFICPASPDAVCAIESRRPLILSLGTTWPVLPNVEISVTSSAAPEVARRVEISWGPIAKAIYLHRRDGHLETQSSAPEPVIHPTPEQRERYFAHCGYWMY